MTAVTDKPTTAAPRGRRRYLVVVALAVVVALVAATLVTIAVRARGWQEVWSDDFSGARGSAPSPENWITDTGTAYPGGAAAWGTGEIQTYTADPANLGLDGDGHLRITATRDASGAWRSARVETRRADFRPAAGATLRVEARLQLASGGPGYWSAFWMLGAPFRPAHTNWPAAGEIDVMENIGSEPTTVHGTFHCGIVSGGPCQETTGLGASRPAVTSGFHTYSVEWDRSGPLDELRWYVDGTVFRTVRASDVSADAWAQATGHGFYVLLNVAIGGGWPGLPTAATRPGASMLVDRVTVSEHK